MSIKATQWLFHPISVFSLTLVGILSALFLFIRSYLQVNDALTEFVEKYRVDASQFQETSTWVTILLLSLLAAAVILGVLLIFLYYQKLIRLYRFQQNFINGFTHELKTPIASLRLYLDTFNKYDLKKEDQKKYINFMIKDTERLNLNVNQILNLSKIEDKSFLPDYETEDLYFFVEEFFKKNPHYFEECDIEVVNKDHGDYTFFFDLRLFEMVIMNLVVNSINYNKSARPKLKIEFSKVGKNYNIDFIDNGIGIQKSELKNVFKKLYQIGKTSKGSGLGLYLAYNIIKLHKGEISAQSEGLGKGSTFRIKLPIKA